MAPGGSPTITTKRYFQRYSIVVVVEDEELVRIIATEFLADEGFVVIEAEHAEEAVSILESQVDDIHVVFSDHLMPRLMNGMALVHHVRHHWRDALRLQDAVGVNFRYPTRPQANRSAIISRLATLKDAMTRVQRIDLNGSVALIERGRCSALWEGSDALVWDFERLRIATDAAGVALWSWNVDTDEIAMDEHAYNLWGMPRNAPVTFEKLSARIHPEDLNRVRAAFQATRAIVGGYEIDFRILNRDAIRWISARGQGDDRGIVDRVMFGVFLDVTERKQAEETREMLAGEMSHRIKNLFAIASALTVIAARSAATTTEMARDLTQRLTDLGRAHDLVRPVPGQQDKAALLGDLLTVLLAPYDNEEAVGSRVHISVPEVRVGQTTVTTLALVVHELATNAIKYGALSVAHGTIDVSCTAHNGDVVVVWTEQGGPSAAGPRKPAGFGSKLVNQSMSGQLGGSIAFDWMPEGMIATLRMSKARLAT